MAENGETLPPASKGPRYYEFEYPYVLPRDDVLELLGEETDASLTPLENAFVRWFLQTGNAQLALQSLLRPAYPFDVKEFSASRIMSRPTVKDVIKKIRKRCPFLRLYNSDYIVELLHDEVQYLRHRNRHQRFYGHDANLNHYSGKKSVHEEETADIDLLLRCVEIIQKFQSQVPNGDPDTKPGNVSSGVDRVIAEAERLIRGTKVSVDERVG